MKLRGSFQSSQGEANIAFLWSGAGHEQYFLGCRGRESCINAILIATRVVVVDDEVCNHTSTSRPLKGRVRLPGYFGGLCKQQVEGSCFSLHTGQWARYAFSAQPE